MTYRLPALPAALLALSCCLLAIPAHADSFQITATGSGLNLTATVSGVTDPGDSTAIDLTSGSGTANGEAITLFTPGGTAASFLTQEFTSPPFPYSSTYMYDNVLFPSASGSDVLDTYGLLFQSSDNHYALGQGGPNIIYADDTIVNSFNGGAVDFTITPLAATPEPTSIALLATGLLGITGTLRRRRA